MRRLLAIGLLGLAGGCDCGAYPASGPREDEPPGTPACGLEAPEPQAIHELGSSAAPIDFGLSACGHLFAVLDDGEWLAGPELARLEGLEPTVGPGALRLEFGPGGEVLRRSRGAETRVLDLVGGGETVLGPARDEQFLPSHDLRRSILRRCTAEGLTALDAGVERLVLPGANCERYAPAAWLAPLTIATDREERLLVVDLERRTVLDTGLPWSQREEPTPDGEPGYRDDAGYLSWDGARVFHEKRWQVFRGDTVDYVGTGELRLIETDGGAATVYPSVAGGPLGFLRTGFVWRSGWDRTHVAGAAGALALDRRCNVSDFAKTGERVLLSCYHESGPTYWQDHLVDTGDLSVRDLGDAWSVRKLSGGGLAIAGCPTDAWRSGSCTVPAIRLWTEHEGVRDLALDRTADVIWVGDDGTSLALSSESDEALLLDPRGAVRTRFPIAGEPEFRQLAITTDGAALLLHLGNGSLELIRPATGFHTRLADVAARVETDPALRRIAFTVPDGERFRLFAGAMPDRAEEP